MGLIDAAGRRGGLASGLGGQLLPGGLASGGLMRGLLLIYEKKVNTIK